MANFLFNLVSNLALLAAVLIVCHLCNRLIPGATLNGPHVFVGLALAALLFDAALTFLVFADAQNRYGQFSTRAAFFQRAGAYGLAGLAASQLDETFQIEQWGEDAEAAARRESLAADIASAALFLELLG